jgi:drug/metabolite transporter (DMT)-like permease
MSDGRPPRGAVAAGFLSVYILWGSTYLGIRIVVETIPPFLGAAARHLAAGLILYTFLRMRGYTAPTRTHWKSGFIVGGLLLLGGNALLMWAEQTVPSSTASIMIATVPLFMVLFDSVLFKGTKITPSIAFALALGLAGVAILVWDPSSLTQPMEPGGALALITAAMLWGLGSVLSRKLPTASGSLMSTATQMLGGGLLIVPVALLLGEGSRLDVAAISWQSWTALGYLIVFGSLIAFSSYTWILKVSTAAKVSTYAYVNPLVAIALGVLIANEAFTLRMMAGATAILLSVATVLTMQRRRPSLPRPAPLEANPPETKPV